MTELLLPSRFQIGAPVSVTFNGPTYLGGIVHGIQFTEGKVHYLVTLDDGKEIAADSADVEPLTTAAERELHALGCYTDTPGSVMCQICGADLTVEAA